jgi:hypothetical protein
MADVSFNVANPYQTQLDELARRQKMAEIMQQQSFQPAERFSYQGIEAPISPLSGIAKALQMYMSGREQGKISEERKALGERYRQEGMDDITRFAEMAGRPAVAAVPGSAAFTPMGSDYEDRGNAPAFKLDEQGMVPAVDSVAARIRGQIDPSMIGQFKTPEMQRMALAAMLKQGEAPAAFNLGAEETRFQPPVGGGTPAVVARGVAKPVPPPPSPFAQINPKDFTQASLAAAMKPDGTIDRTLLVAVTAAPTGNLAELAAENADRKQKGLPPLSISQYREKIASAGRPLAAPRERIVFDTTRGGTVDLDTQEFTPVVQKGVPIGGSPRPAPEAYYKQASALLNINDAITDYRKDLKGFNTVTALSPDQRARVGQKYQNVLLQAKEMYNLGVLNGPDLTILEQIIANPLAIRTAAVSTDALIKQVDQLSGIIKRQNTNLGRVYKQPEIKFDTQSATDPTDTTDPLGIRNK